MKNKYFDIKLTEEQANALIFILFDEVQFENNEGASELYSAIDNQINAQTITDERDF